jgi:hypothetical protein
VLRLQNPDGFVVHTDRLGDAGQYLLSASTRGTTVWRAALPLRWIGDLIPFADTAHGRPRSQRAKLQGEADDLLVTLDLDRRVTPGTS